MFLLFSLIFCYAKIKIGNMLTFQQSLARSGKKPSITSAMKKLRNSHDIFLLTVFLDSNKNTSGSFYF